MVLARWVACGPSMTFIYLFLHASCNEKQVKHDLTFLDLSVAWKTLEGGVAIPAGMAAIGVGTQCLVIAPASVVNLIQFI